MNAERLLVWSVDATRGFDAAWARRDGTRLVANGEAVGQVPEPYTLRYRLETGDRWVTRRLTVESTTASGTASLDLRRDGGIWTVNGGIREDLAEALDCDLGACPLTNTMPILRHDLHRTPGDVTFLMAFVEVPSLRIIPSKQRYTTIEAAKDGGDAVVRYRSGRFRSDLAIDPDGFVRIYPKLGRRIAPVSSARAE
jgi:hypothetical protein